MPKGKIFAMPEFRALPADLADKSTIEQLLLRILLTGFGLAFGAVKIVCEDENWKAPTKQPDVEEMKEIVRLELASNERKNKRKWADRHLKIDYREFWRRLDDPDDPCGQTPYATDLEFGIIPEGWVCIGDMFEHFVRAKKQMQGIVSENLYVGAAGTVACFHPEDGDFAALNYLHWGAGKVWFAIASRHRELFEQLAAKFCTECNLLGGSKACEHWLAHKRLLVHHDLLLKKGIDVCWTIQRPGEMVFALPGGMHMVFNCGLNYASAWNLLPRQMLAFVKDAGYCSCFEKKFQPGFAKRFLKYYYGEKALPGMWSKGRPPALNYPRCVLPIRKGKHTPFLEQAPEQDTLDYWGADWCKDFYDYLHSLNDWLRAHGWMSEEMVAHVVAGVQQTLRDRYGGFQRQIEQRKRGKWPPADSDSEEMEEEEEARPSTSTQMRNLRVRAPAMPPPQQQQQEALMAVTPVWTEPTTTPEGFRPRVGGIRLNEERCGGHPKYIRYGDEEKLFHFHKECREGVSYRRYGNDGRPQYIRIVQIGQNSYEIVHK